MSLVTCGLVVGHVARGVVTPPYIPMTGKTAQVTGRVLCTLAVALVCRSRTENLSPNIYLDDQGRVPIKT